MKLTLFGLCAIAVFATLPLWNTDNTAIAPPAAPRMDTPDNAALTPDAPDSPQAYNYRRYYGGSGRREILS